MCPPPCARGSHLLLSGVCALSAIRHIHIYIYIYVNICVHINEQIIFTQYSCSPLDDKSYHLNIIYIYIHIFIYIYIGCSQKPEKQ